MQILVKFRTDEAERLKECFDLTAVKEKEKTR
jgi:hypothetical protein